MAQVVLSSVGAALGGPVGGAIGSVVGGSLDRAAINALKPARQVGPRLDGLRVTSTAEGAPMAAVFGRARVAGQVIWAARFSERAIEGRSGGKGGTRTVSHAYALSFAVAVCEGPIDGVGRVWADGKPMDMTGVTMRVHRGTEDQTPDALIEAVEGEAPAYRGTAYVVFEDLPLAPYGNRPPQLSFEVFRGLRTAGGLEERLTEVCLIPGAGEFVYATEPVLRRSSLTRTTPENINNAQGRPDLLVSLDQLEAQLPNVKRVLLVVSWFGDDLRMGECEIRPGVERADKATLPRPWRAGGVDRAGARLISAVDGRPNYGGTPSDASVLQAIAELKRRGFEVGLYPFVMMDVLAGNGLPDPHGGAEQAAFPWRGRITVTPGSDGTAAAGAQVAAFFGGATAAQVSVVDGEPRYSGGDGWRYRRMVLHYARLAQIAGGVDTFLIGSELRGITTARDATGGYPAVEQLRALAGECRSVLGAGCAISYAADWTEWSGHQPVDGSGDVAFHLDPLWADPNIDFVGIDWYPPLADQRPGEARPSVADLVANLAGGERFDWFYASEADRQARLRTAITDGAYGEPWVFRAKDIRSWWENTHHDRPDGVRSAAPTAWVPRSKPVRLTEFGCPAADKGANSPNLFVDAKSSEGALPPFSDGSRDDLGQRRALEATLAWFDEAANNPVSDVYGGPMVEGMSAWCWDARPFPDFPGRGRVWADGGNWALGHWLNGRAGSAGAAAALAMGVLARGGLSEADVDASEVVGTAAGYVVDRPMSLREALAPLGVAFAFDAAEQGGGIKLVAREGLADIVTDEALAWPDAAVSPEQAARRLEPAPDAVRVRFIDEAADYQTGAAAARTAAVGGGSEDVDLPLVTEPAGARRVAERRLRTIRAERDTLTLEVGPLEALRREPGDRVVVEGRNGLWRVARVDVDERPSLTLTRCEAGDTTSGPEPWAEPGGGEPPLAGFGPPVLHVLDLGPLPGAEADTRPLIAVSAEPWRPLSVSAGLSAEALTVRARVDRPAAVGVTVTPLTAGSGSRLDRGALTVRVEGGRPSARSWAALTGGGGLLAVQAPSGEWEVLQHLGAELVEPDVWRLDGFVRALAGSDPAAAQVKLAGASVVLLTGALARAEIMAGERGADLLWRAAPADGPSTGLGATEITTAWRGVALRPWAPAHLRSTRRPGGDVVFSWVRRGRLSGEGLDAEPPLSEEAERYRAELLSATGAAVRAWEVGGEAAVWTAAEQVEDFPAGAPPGLRLRVRQGSAVFGWGAPAERPIVG
jgi:hypothetical protein